MLPELGYEQSAMDPCAFKFIGVNENGVHELQGLVIVEVDDLLCVGNAAREKVLEQLRSASRSASLWVFRISRRDAPSMEGD